MIVRKTSRLGKADDMTYPPVEPVPTAVPAGGGTTWLPVGMAKGGTGTELPPPMGELPGLPETPGAAGEPGTPDAPGPAGELPGEPADGTGTGTLAPDGGRVGTTL